MACDHCQHPSDWERCKLSQICRSITDGSHFSPIPQSHGHPIANVKDFRDGYIDIESCTKITDSAFSILQAGHCTISPGDVLFSKDGTVGKVVVYRQDAVIAALSSICIIQPGRNIDSSYLGQALSSQDITRQIANSMSGSALRRLVLRDIKALEIHLPSHPEQRRIAEILDTVDEAIRRTEQVIEKLQQIKQGLLHDLLTRGIDDNGELRPPPEQAPHLYKDSPLGLIPRPWRVVGIGELAECFDGRRIPLKQSDRDTMSGCIPYYGASGIIDWIDRYIFDGDYVLLGEDGENVISRRLPLAFNVRGCFWVNNHAHVFKPRDCVDVEFLTEVLEATDYCSYASGSAQPKLTQDALGRVRFPLPSIPEQTRVLKILTLHNDRVDKENRNVDKLRILKKGLMDDLLTGRVRVNVPEGEC